MAEILTDNKVLMERVEMLLKGQVAKEESVSVELTDCVIDEMYSEVKRQGKESKAVKKGN